MSFRSAFHRIIRGSARPHDWRPEFKYLHSGGRRAFKPRLELLENRACPSSLAFSTYLGGSGLDIPQGPDCAVDAAGNTYVAGQTFSTNSPTTTGSFQPSYPGSGAGFIAKFDASGALVWSTYLGGSAQSNITALALDASGNVYVTGFTMASNFPTTAGTLEPTYPGGNEAAFVTELNASGSALVYSTFVGHGANGAVGRGIAVDRIGNTYVAIETGAAGNTTTPGAFQATDPDSSASTYIAKLNPGGKALSYATYLGGSRFDVPRGVGLDASGNLYVDGVTTSNDFPATPGAVQGSNPGAGTSNNGSGYVAKLNSTGTALLYATYLGGNAGRDSAMGNIALDSAGNAYVTGVTFSTNFPTANALQPHLNGSASAFVSKLNPTGTALVYSTYLGGSGSDFGYDIAVDSFGNAYVAGSTTSTNFPTANPIQAQHAGGQDAFVTELRPAGTALVFSTYLGGNGNDGGYSGVGIDGAGNIHISGQTTSTDFPTTPGAFQSTYGGGRSNLFVAVIGPDTWTGQGPDNNWSDGANWRGGSAPNPGDDLEFPSGASQLANNNDFPDGTSFSSITFTGGGYDISGAGISLTSGMSAKISSGGTATVEDAITLAANTTFTINSGTTLILSGNVTGNSGLQLTGSGVLDVAGSLDTTSSVNVANGATLDVPGTLILEQNATLTDNGNVIVDQGGALDDFGAATVAKNATLVDNSSGAHSIAGVQVEQGAELTIQGALTVQAGGTLDDFASMTVGSTGSLVDQSSGSSGVAGVQVEAGALLANQGNTQASGTSSGNGVLIVNGLMTGSLTVAAGGFLEGTGSVGNVTASGGGTVLPGAVGSIGILSAQSVNLTNGGVLYIQITGYQTPGSDFSRLATGTLTLGGTSKLTLDLSGLTTKGTVRGIVTDGGQSGTFSAVQVINNPLSFGDSVVYRNDNIDVTIF